MKKTTKYVEMLRMMIYNNIDSSHKICENSLCRAARLILICLSQCSSDEIYITEQKGEKKVKAH